MANKCLLAIGVLTVFVSVIGVIYSFSVITQCNFWIDNCYGYRCEDPYIKTLEKMQKCRNWCVGSLIVGIIELVAFCCLTRHQRMRAIPYGQVNQYQRFEPAVNQPYINQPYVPPAPRNPYNHLNPAYVPPPPPQAPIYHVEPQAQAPIYYAPSINQNRPQPVHSPIYFQNQSSVNDNPYQVQRERDFGNECPICLESFMDWRSSYRNNSAECGHNFHKKCLDRWVQINPMCPLCRKRLK